MREGERGQKRGFAISAKELSLLRVKVNTFDLILQAEKGSGELRLLTEAFPTDKKVSDVETQAFLGAFPELCGQMLRSNGAEARLSSAPLQEYVSTKNYLFGAVSISKKPAFRFRITISGPPDLLYDINQSYGDLAVQSDLRELRLYQFSGELQAQNLALAELELKYGEAQLGSIAQARIELFEVNFQARQIDQLHLNAKYTKVLVQQVQDMQGEGFESDYRFQSLGQLEGDYKYGRMEVSGALNRARLSLFEFELSCTSARQWEIESKYSSFALGQIDELHFSSSFEDALVLKKVGRLRMDDARYGRIEMGELSGNFRLQAFECEVDVQSLAASGKGTIDLEGKYLELKLNSNEVDLAVDFASDYGTVKSKRSDLLLRRTNKGPWTAVQGGKQDETDVAYRLKVRGFEVELELY